MIRFECVNPATNSDKFWEFDVLDSTNVLFRYGRRGTSGQEMRKSFATFASMQKSLEDSVREKLGKGYVPVKTNNMGRTMLPPSSREREIEAGLSRGIQKQLDADQWEREKEAERQESQWRREEMRREQEARRRADRAWPMGEIIIASGGGGGGGAGGSGGGSITINAKGLDLPLKGVADAMREAASGIARTMGVDWAEGEWRPDRDGGRIRGGPRMGQPRERACPHPDLSKTSDGYVCRSCGKSVGPAAAPEVATVLTLKVKRKIVLDD